MQKERLLELAGIQLDEGVGNLTSDESDAVRKVIEDAWSAAMDEDEEEIAGPLKSAFKKLFNKDLEY